MRMKFAELELMVVKRILVAPLEDKFVRFPDFLVDLESLRISFKIEMKAKSHSFGKEEKNKSC